MSKTEVNAVDSRPVWKSPIDVTMFCERSVGTPIDTFVPNQAIQLSELVARFERGQRLNVHTNFDPGSNFESITDEEAFNRLRQEDMDADDFPPTGVYDVADVQRHYEDLQEHKRDFKRRMKEKRQKPVPPTPPAAPTTPDPAQ